MLEGLHFDVLLGMSWIKKANAVVQAIEGILSINGEKFKYKPYPKPASFLAEEGGKILQQWAYCVPTWEECGCTGQPSSSDQKWSVLYVIKGTIEIWRGNFKLVSHDGLIITVKWKKKERQIRLSRRDSVWDVYPPVEYYWSFSKIKITLVHILSFVLII